MRKKRKVPLRKCIVTKEMKPKQELIRIVRNKQGEIFVDPEGKQNGRGAYISKDIEVIQKAINLKILNEQFKSDIDQDVYNQLSNYVKGQENE